VRLGIAEEGHHAVAEVFGDVAAVTGDRFCGGAMIGGDRLAPFFGVEPRGNLSGADQVAKQHRQMPPLAASRRRYGCGMNRGCWHCITQGSATFAAEAFARLVCGATLRAGDDERCATSRTEFAPFAIIAATF